MPFAVAPELTIAAIFVKLPLLLFRGTMPLNGMQGRKMTTLSITANFYTDDPKAAKR